MKNNLIENRLTLNYVQALQILEWAGYWKDWRKLEGKFEWKCYPEKPLVLFPRWPFLPLKKQRWRLCELMRWQLQPFFPFVVSGFSLNLSLWSCSGCIGRDEDAVRCKSLPQQEIWIIVVLMNEERHFASLMNICLFPGVNWSGRLLNLRQGSFQRLVHFHWIHLLFLLLFFDFLKNKIKSCED